MKLVEKELRDLTVENEMLRQAFGKVSCSQRRSDHARPGRRSHECFYVRQVQQERDELLKKQMELILDLQQKSGLKELLLERKLSALTETLEQKEAQLCAALSASSVDQTAAGSAANKLEV